MNRLPLLLSLIAVMVVLPLAARPQSIDSRLTHVLEFGGKRAVLATFLLLVTWLPGMLLLMLQVAFAGSFEFLLNFDPDEGPADTHSGGTGFAPRDVTPEATRRVIEREAPGLAEYARAATVPRTKFAVLSRGVAGIRRRTLIINLPGSPKAALEMYEALAPLLPHALETLAGGGEVHPVS